MCKHDKFISCDRQTRFIKNMQRITALIFFMVFYFIADSASALELKWTGCGITKKAFMGELAKVYEAKTNVKIKLSGGGATKGIRSVSANSSDLGGSCRHLLIDSAGAIHKEENNSELIHVAWDALVAVVHKKNPITGTTLEDLKKIYNGEITSWKVLGGEDKRIVLLSRGGQGKHSGVGYMFRLLVFNDPDYDFKARSLIFKSSGSLEIKLEKTPWALGLTGISSAKKRDLKVLSLNGISPTKDNIASGEYPLFRPLYLVINKKSTDPKARKFIDFALSPEGQAIISGQGTVNLLEGKVLFPLWKKKTISDLR